MNAAVAHYVAPLVSKPADIYGSPRLATARRRRRRRRSALRTAR